MTLSAPLQAPTPSLSLTTPTCRDEVDNVSAMHRKAMIDTRADNMIMVKYIYTDACSLLALDVGQHSIVFKLPQSTSGVSSPDRRILKFASLVIHTRVTRFRSSS